MASRTACVFSLYSLSVRRTGVNDFESAFATMAKERAQAVIVVGSFDPHRRRRTRVAVRQLLAPVRAVGVLRRR
jgi:hypothetical protein